MFGKNKEIRQSVMNELIKDALHTKMQKLERKLEKYATVYFGKDIAIMYVPKDNLKVGNPNE